MVKDALSDQLRELRIEPGSVLVVHTSFRAVAPVQYGPVELIEGLHEAIGPSGTLVMPSMSSSQSPMPFDPATTPTRGMGIVAETFWRMPETLRGDHPTSSFAARGPRAAHITAPQSLSPVHGPESPIGRVFELDGSILLLGVGHAANTTIHLAEALAEVPYRTRKAAHVLRDGMPSHVEYDETDHCCRNFDLLDGWLRERGLQREGKVGHAWARLVRSKDVVDAVVLRLKRDPLLFLCDTSAQCEDCDAARASVGVTRAPSHQVRVRRAGPDDAEGIADVHVRSWRSTYAGIVPDRVIEEMAAGRDTRIERSRAWLSESDGTRRGWVAEEDGAIIGMAVTAPSRDPDAASSTGELEAIYLAPETMGRGVGRQLMQAVEVDLRQRGFSEATLWVLTENRRARRFYEAAGWQADGATKDEKRPGATLHETRYRRPL